MSSVFHSQVNPRSFFILLLEMKISTSASSLSSLNLGTSIYNPIFFSIYIFTCVIPALTFKQRGKYFAKYLQTILRPSPKRIWMSLHVSHNCLISGVFFIVPSVLTSISNCAPPSLMEIQEGRLQWSYCVVSRDLAEMKFTLCKRTGKFCIIWRLNNG